MYARTFSPDTELLTYVPNRPCDLGAGMMEIIL
jgi:hypothetical protein